MFSKRFYDKFGHETVTELADWLNRMDLTYRTQLRERDDVNSARFDAKLEQRIGEVKAELHREMTEAKSELREEIGQLRGDMRAGFAELESRLSDRLIRWMFVFWTGTTITLLLAVFAIMGL
jgi:hypothetical protein